MKAFALIVNGNLRQAQQYQQALQSAGFQVEIVSTGARAQVQLAFATPDLILMNNDLPDMPGEVLLRQIYAYRRLDDTVLFLLSADGNFRTDSGRLLAYAFAQAVDPSVLASLASDVFQLGAQL